MNAFEIVSLLLEAEMSAADRTGVYVFGPRLPKDGHVARDMNQALIHLRHMKVIPPDVAEGANMVDALVREGYTFIIKHHPGNIEVIGERVPVRTTPEGVEKATKFLGLEKHDAVAYRKYTTGSPASLDVAQVLYGEKPPKEGTGTQKRWQPDKPEDMSGFPETGKGYSGDFMPIDAPISLGFTFDRGSKEGVIIKEVHPGGPAAQAGLKAGDVIVQTGEFVSTEGEPLGPFYVYNQKHLEYVLRKADPNYPILFRVIRGDQELWLPMQAQSKQQEQNQQQQQGRPVQTSMARKLFAKEKKPRQRRFNFRPNEPTPTRQTGNAPASVSSLT